MKLRYTISLWLLFCAFLFSWSQTGYAQRGVLSSLEEDITSLVESVKPSLVTIQTGSRAVKGTKGRDAPSTFVGSGIIYTSDGYILTSASVVYGMRSFKVTLPNEKSVDGKLVGTDDESNLAVLKVESVGLTPAKLGDSDRIKVGSWLTVVGNSYGLPNAAALGLVNGVRDDGFIQMSANVSPGNSGGPVLDTYGNVIGLVAAKLSEPSYLGAIQIYDEKRKTITIPARQIDIPSSGVSLALPINKIKTVASEIIKHGSVRRGYLGIYPQDLAATLQKRYGLSKGVLVADVVEGSPAHLAGLSKGDIITRFAGVEVTNGDHIRKLIQEKRAEEPVELMVIRNGNTRDLTAVLTAAKPAYSSYSWWADVDIPKAPDIPSAELYYQEAYDYLQQVQGGWPNLQRDPLDELQQELKKLQQEMKKMSEELERLKTDKAKE